MKSTIANRVITMKKPAFAGFFYDQSWKMVDNLELTLMLHSDTEEDACH